MDDVDLKVTEKIRKALGNVPDDLGFTLQFEIMWVTEPPYKHYIAYLTDNRTLERFGTTFSPEYCCESGYTRIPEEGEIFKRFENFILKGCNINRKRLPENRKRRRN